MSGTDFSLCYMKPKTNAAQGSKALGGIWSNTGRRLLCDYSAVVLSHWRR